MVLELPTPKAAPREPPSAPTPIPRAPYPPATRNLERAEVWVKVTLFLVVVALLLVCMALPVPGPRREAAQAERRLIGTQLVLDELRAVLADYHTDHGQWPGQGPDGQGGTRLLEDQIALPTTAQGEVLVWEARESQRARLGPYREGGVPLNPANGLASVRFLRADEPWPLEADGATGWIYRPSTGEVRANAPGRAAPGAPRFFDL